MTRQHTCPKPRSGCRKRGPIIRLPFCPLMQRHGLGLHKTRPSLRYHRAIPFLYAGRRLLNESLVQGGGVFYRQQHAGLLHGKRARHRRTGVYTKTGSLRRSVIPDEAWHICVGRIGGSMHERGIIHATQARFPEN